MATPKFERNLSYLRCHATENWVDRFIPKNESSPHKLPLTLEAGYEIEQICSY